MKRTLFIVAGIVIVILIVAIWVYLMLFGSPKTGGEIFANFGFGTTDRTESPLPEDPGVAPLPEYTVDVSSDRLTQLTTRAVAGFVGTTTNDVPHVRYAEVGTGHICDINLQSGEETLLSRTTIPRVQNAFFAPNATVVALESFNGYQESSYFGFIDEVTQSIKGIDLPPNINNLTVTANNRARFVRAQGDSSTGYESKLDGTLSEIFKTPFQSITVMWGSDANRLYNRPDKSLMGHLYKLSTTKMNATTISGYGLVVDDFGEYLGYSVYEGSEVKSTLVNKTTNQTIKSPILILPEKCDGIGNDVWCAAPFDKDFALTEWYKGLTSSDDSLWKFDSTTGIASLAANLEDIAGRTLDINEIAHHPATNSVFFTNKTDGTLWRFTTNN